MSLEGKVALVTGGTRGIGKSIVLELAGNGMDIAFNYNKNKTNALQLVEKINEMGRKALAFQVSVTDFEGIKEMVRTIKKDLGRLDILVNNAGITRDKSLVLMSREDWGEVIETNLTGVFNCTRNVIFDFLKQKSGKIINITSVSGIIGLPQQVNYSSSKAGIIGFTKALAKEVGSHNITVNAIAPGGVATDMLDSLSEKYKEEMLKTIPLKRFGEPEEIAKAVTYLASDAGNYMTGQVLQIDGGQGI
jgi:3-oxoacyl-[acyl-carrier protein] reductase